MKSQIESWRAVLGCDPKSSTKARCTKYPTVLTKHHYPRVVLRWSPVLCCSLRITGVKWGRCGLLRCSSSGGPQAPLVVLRETPLTFSYLVATSENRRSPKQVQVSRRFRRDKLDLLAQGLGGVSTPRTSGGGNEAAILDRSYRVNADHVDSSKRIQQNCAT